MTFEVFLDSMHQLAEVWTGGADLQTQVLFLARYEVWGATESTLTSPTLCARCLSRDRTAAGLGAGISSRSSHD